jgi:hypothetical protein
MMTKGTRTGFPLPSALVQLRSAPIPAGDPGVDPRLRLW